MRYTPVLLIIALAACQSCSAVAVPSAQNILSGQCVPCVFEDISLNAGDGYQSRLHLGVRIDKSDGAQLRALFSRQRKRVNQQLQFERITVFERVDGTRRARELGVQAINRCIEERQPDCETRIPLDELASHGESLALSIVSTIGEGIFPGRHYVRAIDTPGRWSGTRFGLRLSSQRNVFVDGDIEPADEAGKWRYRDKGAGYLVISTLASWPDAAAAYRDAERGALGAEAAESLPPATIDATRVEQALDKSWQTIRASMHYDSRQWDEVSVLGPQPLATTVETGRGDCGDFALLFAALLRREGVDAQVVLVGSAAPRRSSKSSLPGGNSIDHALVYVPAKQQYFDPTLAPAKSLPTGGRRNYPFALNTQTGERSSVSAAQTK